MDEGSASRVLITGSSGFIGGRLFERFRELLAGNRSKNVCPNRMGYAMYLQHSPSS